MEIVDKIEEKLDITFVPEKIEDSCELTIGATFAPIDILDYIYAVLHSPAYREKYKEFLKIDFPRVPFTKDYKIFKKLSEIGKGLIDIHLLKSSLLDKTSSRFKGEGELNLVKKIVYSPKEKRVFINEKQYFENIEPEVWNYFIGGYQVLNKWLKDRKGKYLNDEEVKNYIKIIEAIKNTIKIQKEIDRFYPQIEKNLLT